MIDEKVRTTEQLQKPETGGLWHNVYLIDSRVNRNSGCGWIHIEGFRYMWDQGHPTREIAETHRADDPYNGCACYVLAELADELLFIWEGVIHVKG